MYIKGYIARNWLMWLWTWRGRTQVPRLDSCERQGSQPQVGCFCLHGGSALLLDTTNARHGEDWEEGVCKQ
jgi:hypothetical protein